ncbi:MAG: 2-dehydropantoate 2-reductase, partial [Actinomycetota bacterium]|nr:2-dehydropantoate 2-reductase [Actinomycetota bacterium]
MRFVVYGAGAVGGVLGGRLAQHGHDVTLIPRGRHLDAIRTNGLRVEDPDDTVVLPLPCVASPAEIDLGADDVVLVAMKTQDTAAALADLAAVVPTTTPVVCVQNGVVNETMALRRFAHVYGVAVMLPTQFLEPGVVQAYSAPTTGLLDIGHIPGGDVDGRAVEIATAFSASRLLS